jgi:hypothetical protein
MEEKPRNLNNPEFEYIIEKAHAGTIDVDQWALNRQEKFILHHAAGNEGEAHDLAMDIILDEGYSLEAHGEEIEIESESFEGHSQFRISRNGEWLLPHDVTLSHKFSDACVDLSAEVFGRKLHDELQRIENQEPAGAAARDAWARSRGI